MARLIDLPEMIVRDVAALPGQPYMPHMLLVSAAELDRIVTYRVDEVAKSLTANKQGEAK